ncbi:hypothetical protein PRZ48_011185 [Zasmidium cellare]|uniref:Protein kinase domain-containing protein n=1 Tax=Zasmidium cellare TaxID=395010 RepID=A0ABR0EAP2_ZASCE|nr:hypothetical protein PRZ48_011185 [Zasmidium cellare]
MSTSSYTLCSGSIDQVTLWVVVMRGRAQFDITVHLSRIQGTDLEKQLTTEIEKHRTSLQRGLVPSFEPLHSICKPCLPLLLELAPTKSVCGLSLENFVNAPTYNLELVGENSQIQILGGETCSYAPVLELRPINLADIPQNDLPLFSAKTIRANIDNQESIGSTQGKVSTIDGEVLYFKPRESGREGQFDRELRILLEIQSRGLIMRVPRLQGLVISNETLCTGLLLPLIPAGMDLLHPQTWTLHSLHEKWEAQVRSIVEELHAHYIVWGDVNPGNVVIDEAMDAWVIDFGGGNNAEFVGDGERESVVGDLRGVGRLFGGWLGRRREGVPL